MRRRDRIGASVLWITCAGWLLLPACGDLYDGPNLRSDAGDREASDAASGGEIDAAQVPGTSEYDEAASIDAARGGCFDGEDNDSDGRSDCDDRSCQENVSSCCVGASNDVCCEEGPAAALEFAACAPSLATCLDPTMAIVFGSPAPSVRVDAARATLLPGGFESDSGVLMSRSLDPRGGVQRVEAQIASPLTAPEADRVEYIAVGFVDAEITPERIARVTPVASVTISRNRREIMLNLFGEVAQRWPLTTDAPVRYSLELDPAGQVRLSTDPNILSAERPLAVSGPVRALVYGRTVNPAGSEPPARLLSLGVSSTRCDMPSALVRRTDTVVPAPLGEVTWADEISSIAQPDVLRYGADDTVRMVLMVDGEVHLAEPNDGGFVLLSNPGTSALPALADDWAADGVSAPALAYEDSELVLYFTGWADGRGTIARAVFADATASFTGAAPVPGLAATSDAHYSAAAPFLIGAAPHAIVRVDGPEGHRLALFALDETSGARELGTVRTPTAGDPFAFDHDEVDTPAVVRRDGVYRVYFSGRRGTRWSIGVVVSDDGLYWRDPTPGAILSGRGDGFDALSVRDPALDLVDGALRLYYTGGDGTVDRIGGATAP